MPSPLHPHLGECLSRGVSATPRDGRLREFPRLLLFAPLLLCMICTSCGAIGSGPAAPPPPPPATVTVTPNSAQLFPGGNMRFKALVENASSSAVNWQLSPASIGNGDVGTITSDGNYTAPNSPAMVTVNAVLQADPTKTGSAVVTIQGSLSISPALESVTTSQTLQLQVTNANVSNTQVNWTVTCISIGTCSTGTITPSGEFVPPITAGLNIVTAALIGNPNVTGSARVEVTDFPGTLTWRNDNSRSGVNSQELALAPATVSSSTFGKLFSCPIDGYAYAQPLYMPNLPIAGLGTHNVIFVATEKDSVFAFDADANPCKQLWKTSLIPAGSQAIETPILGTTSADIVPFVGITGTPVIGGMTPTLYVVAAAQIPAINATYSQQLYALDLTTVPPEVQPPGVEITSPAGQASVFFPSHENQRSALLFDNGTVYIAFGSNGVPGDYHGWLFGYDSSSSKQTGVFNVTPNAIQGGIWQSGGGPSADLNHNIFVVTGDGPFDANRGGMSYSNSFLRLITSGGGLSVSDYFTPCDQQTLETAGQDVGASAPVLLPDSPSQPNLLIGGSKNGSLYVVNRDNLGKFDTACPDSPTRVQTIPVGAGPILSTPLFWNNFVYVAPGNGKLLSFPMSGGVLSSTPTSQSPEPLGPQGATPVISSNGTNNAILWLIDSSGALTNMPAVLRAYDPNNLSNEIYNSAMVPSRGLAVKFTVPTVANGKVYVGTKTQVDVYGLLP